MNEITSPVLKAGEKMHYCIFHDETCIHAGDQCKCTWQRDGDQPLRDKSRGRISHCSDYIIEHCGRLVLSADEIAKQMTLPEEPHPPLPAIPNPPPLPDPRAPVIVIEPPAASITVVSQAKPQRKQKPKKAKKVKDVPTPKPVAGRRTLARPDGWVPPPPPAPFTSYRLSSFDARRIIYPGKNYDPWWDMPQLIVQVSNSINSKF